jgi:hypothetical protein
MTIRSDLDELIDWYEQHCHIAGRVIPVIAARSTIHTFARKRRGGPFTYRDCEIVPIRRARKRRPKNEPMQTELTP